MKVFTGNVPFHNSITATAIASIITGGRPERPTHPDFTERLWKLARWCWKEKPEDRPRMDQVIEQLSVPPLHFHEQRLIHTEVPAKFH